MCPTESQWAVRILLENNNNNEKNEFEILQYNNNKNK